MSEHTVTTTASYILNKYSRSYPPTSSVGAQAPVESEWQHFTNPIMKIILEAKRSPSGQLVSMRLRISWCMHIESIDPSIDQREVIFEDLELLSFSSLLDPVQSDQSLPLKAVYRDAVVGIRYLHPKVVPAGTQPTYRRFQITFKDMLDASRCIGAIKSVCPCKANPQPNHMNRQSTILPPVSLARAATTISHVTPAQSRLTKQQSTPSAPADFRSISSATLGHSLENQSFSLAPLSAATHLSSDDGTFVTCSETSCRSDMQVDYRKGGQPENHGRDWTQSSLPDLPQPSSSGQSIAMPPPPVPRRPAHSEDTVVQEQPKTIDSGDERLQLLTSLNKHPFLYELSRIDLETLVSQVIREEGFLHLLDSLDSLWRIKGLLGR